VVRKILNILQTAVESNPNQKPWNDADSRGSSIYSINIRGVNCESVISWILTHFFVLIPTF
jgi:hypothetical protein